MDTLAKRSTGRPTKYTPAMIDMTLRYIHELENAKDDFPTIEGLSNRIGVATEQIQDYCERYPSFRQTILKLKQAQKVKLLREGMYDKYKASDRMAIFLLKANHGMIETEKHILSGDPENPLIQFDLYTPVGTIKANDKKPIKGQLVKPKR